MSQIGQALLVTLHLADWVQMSDHQRVDFGKALTHKQLAFGGAFRNLELDLALAVGPAHFGNFLTIDSDLARLVAPRLALPVAQNQPELLLSNSSSLSR